MRKFFGFKSITSLLYGLLMLLPMFSILSRVIYVQSNPNALESYYGETINQSEYINVNENTLILNKNYLLTIDTTTYSYNSIITLNIDNLTNFNTSYALSTTAQNAINNNEVKVLRFTKYESNYLLALMRDVNSSSIANIRVNEYTINGNFDLIGYTSNVSNVYQFIYTLVYNHYSFLDNAFDYSLKTFIDDNNYGFNFFSWFGDMFLNQSGNNMIYLNFINWYLNYGLLISVAYIFFLILLWFINLSRRILDRLMNFDGGGY